MQRLIQGMCFVLVLGLFAPAAASAQDQWVTQVRNMLRQAAQDYEDNGYELTHEIHTGSLGNGGSETITLTLDIGTSYSIIGACDEDCDDLDLVLYDPQGDQVDEDTLVDDFPIVEVTVPRTGQYTIEVIMASCTAEPCRYGLGAFGK